MFHEQCWIIETILLVGLFVYAFVTRTINFGWLWRFEFMVCTYLCIRVDILIIYIQIDISCLYEYSKGLLRLWNFHRLSDSSVERNRTVVAEVVKMTFMITVSARHSPIE